MLPRPQFAITCFKAVFLHPSGIVFNGLANFPKHESARSISSSGMNGGTLEIITFRVGLANGETATKSPLTEIPLLTRRLTRFSSFKKTTTALFILEAEEMFSYPICSPIDNKTSSTATLDSTSHLTPWRSDNGSSPPSGRDAISTPSTILPTTLQTHFTFLNSYF